MRLKKVGWILADPTNGQHLIIFDWAHKWLTLLSLAFPPPPRAPPPPHIVTPGEPLQHKRAKKLLQNYIQHFAFREPFRIVGTST